MRIELRTRVPGNYRDIMDRFDRKLFEALAPPVGKLEIVEFTGSKRGDRVHIRFLSPVKAEWISAITDHGQDEATAWFVDEGVKLPFPLKYWRHRHVVEKLGEEESVIVDDISFRAENPLFTLLMYPLLFFGFYPRKRIYRKYFRVA